MQVIAAPGQPVGDHPGPASPTGPAPPLVGHVSGLDLQARTLGIFVDGGPLPVPLEGLQLATADGHRWQDDAAQPWRLDAALSAWVELPHRVTATLADLERVNDQTSPQRAEQIHGALAQEATDATRRGEHAQALAIVDRIQAITGEDSTLHNAALSNAAEKLQSRLPAGSSFRHRQAERIIEHLEAAQQRGNPQIARQELGTAIDTMFALDDLRTALHFCNEAAYAETDPAQQARWRERASAIAHHVRLPYYGLTGGPQREELTAEGSGPPLVERSATPMARFDNRKIAATYFEAADQGRPRDPGTAFGPGQGWLAKTVKEDAAEYRVRRQVPDATGAQAEQAATRARLAVDDLLENGESRRAAARRAVLAAVDAGVYTTAMDLAALAAAADGGGYWADAHYRAVCARHQAWQQRPHPQERQDPTGRWKVLQVPNGADASWALVSPTGDVGPGEYSRSDAERLARTCNNAMETPPGPAQPPAEEPPQASEQEQPTGDGAGAQPLAEGVREAGEGPGVPAAARGNATEAEGAGGRTEGGQLPVAEPGREVSPLKALADYRNADPKGGDWQDFLRARDALAGVVQTMASEGSFDNALRLCSNAINAHEEQHRFWTQQRGAVRRAQVKSRDETGGAASEQLGRFHERFGDLVGDRVAVHGPGGLIFAGNLEEITGEGLRLHAADSGQDYTAPLDQVEMVSSAGQRRWVDANLEACERALTGARRALERGDYPMARAHLRRARPALNTGPEHIEQEWKDTYTTLLDKATFPRDAQDRPVLQIEQSHQGKVRLFGAGGRRAPADQALAKILYASPKLLKSPTENAYVTNANWRPQTVQRRLTRLRAALEEAGYAYQMVTEPDPDEPPEPQEAAPPQPAETEAAPAAAESEPRASRPADPPEDGVLAFTHRPSGLSLGDADMRALEGRNVALAPLGEFDDPTGGGELVMGPLSRTGFLEEPVEGTVFVDTGRPGDDRWVALSPGAITQAATTDGRWTWKAPHATGPDLEERLAAYGHRSAVAAVPLPGHVRELLDLLNRAEALGPQNWYLDQVRGFCERARREGLYREAVAALEQVPHVWAPYRAVDAEVDEQRTQVLLDWAEGLPSSPRAVGDERAVQEAVRTLERKHPRYDQRRKNQRPVPEEVRRQLAPARQEAHRAIQALLAQGEYHTALTWAAQARSIDWDDAAGWHQAMEQVTGAAVRQALDLDTVPAPADHLGRAPAPQGAEEAAEAGRIWRDAADALGHPGAAQRIQAQAEGLIEQGRHGRALELLKAARSDAHLARLYWDLRDHLLQAEPAHEASAEFRAWAEQTQQARGELARAAAEGDTETAQRAAEDASSLAHRLVNDLAEPAAYREAIDLARQAARSAPRVRGSGSVQGRAAALCERYAAYLAEHPDAVQGPDAPPWEPAARATAQASAGEGEAAAPAQEPASPEPPAQAGPIVLPPQDQWQQAENARELGLGEGQRAVFLLRNGWTMETGRDQPRLVMGTVTELSSGGVRDRWVRVAAADTDRHIATNDLEEVVTADGRAWRYHPERPWVLQDLLALHRAAARPDAPEDLVRALQALDGLPRDAQRLRDYFTRDRSAARSALEACIDGLAEEAPEQAAAVIEVADRLDPLARTRRLLRYSMAAYPPEEALPDKLLRVEHHDQGRTRLRGVPGDADLHKVLKAHKFGDRGGGEWAMPSNHSAELRTTRLNQALAQAVEGLGYAVIHEGLHGARTHHERPQDRQADRPRQQQEQEPVDTSPLGNHRPDPQQEVAPGRRGLEAGVALGRGERITGLLTTGKTPDRSTRPKLVTGTVTEVVESGPARWVTIAAGAEEARFLESDLEELVYEDGRAWRLHGDRQWVLPDLADLQQKAASATAPEAFGPALEALDALPRRQDRLKPPRPAEERVILGERTRLNRAARELAQHPGGGPEAALAVLTLADRIDPLGRLDRLPLRSELVFPEGTPMGAEPPAGVLALRPQARGQVWVRAPRGAGDIRELREVLKEHKFVDHVAARWTRGARLGGKMWRLPENWKPETCRRRLAEVAVVLEERLGYRLIDHERGAVLYQQEQRTARATPQEQAAARQDGAGAEEEDQERTAAHNAGDADRPVKDQEARPQAEPDPAPLDFEAEPSTALARAPRYWRSADPAGRRPAARAIHGYHWHLDSADLPGGPGRRPMRAEIFGRSDGMVQARLHRYSAAADEYLVHDRALPSYGMALSAAAEDLAAAGMEQARQWWSEEIDRLINTTPRSLLRAAGQDGAPPPPLNARGAVEVDSPRDIGVALCLVKPRKGHPFVAPMWLDARPKLLMFPPDLGNEVEAAINTGWVRISDVQEITTLGPYFRYRWRADKKRDWDLDPNALTDLAALPEGDSERARQAYRALGDAEIIKELQLSLVTVVDPGLEPRTLPATEPAPVVIEGTVTSVSPTHMMLSLRSSWGEEHPTEKPFTLRIPLSQLLAVTASDVRWRAEDAPAPPQRPSRLMKGEEPWTADPQTPAAERAQAALEVLRRTAARSRKLEGQIRRAFNEAAGQMLDQGEHTAVAEMINKLDDRDSAGIWGRAHLRSRALYIEGERDPDGAVSIRHDGDRRTEVNGVAPHDEPLRAALAEHKFVERAPGTWSLHPGLSAQAHERLLRLLLSDLHRIGIAYIHAQVHDELNAAQRPQTATESNGPQPADPEQPPQDSADQPTPGTPEEEDIAEALSRNMDRVHALIEQARHNGSYRSAIRQISAIGRELRSPEVSTPWEQDLIDLMQEAREHARDLEGRIRGLYNQQGALDLDEALALLGRYEDAVPPSVRSDDELEQVLQRAQETLTARAQEMRPAGRLQRDPFTYTPPPDQGAGPDGGGTGLGNGQPPGGWTEHDRVVAEPDPTVAPEGADALTRARAALEGVKRQRYHQHEEFNQALEELVLTGERAQALDLAAEASAHSIYGRWDWERARSLAAYGNNPEALDGAVRIEHADDGPTRVLGVDPGDEQLHRMLKAAKFTRRKDGTWRLNPNAGPTTRRNRLGELLDALNEQGRGYVDEHVRAELAPLRTNGAAPPRQAPEQPAPTPEEPAAPAEEPRHQGPAALPGAVTAAADLALTPSGHIGEPGDVLDLEGVTVARVRPFTARFGPRKGQRAWTVVYDLGQGREAVRFADTDPGLDQGQVLERFTAKITEHTTRRGGQAQTQVEVIEAPEPSRFTLTEEQQAIRRHALAGDKIVVQAGAGTGKTSTLEQVVEALAEQGRKGAYVVYGRANANEAQNKLAHLPVRANTMHAFAREAVGRPYAKRINGDKAPRWSDVARRLGLEDLELPGGTVVPAA
ncbi:AAA family ATPase, partial [Nocardiopsis halophila]|uniref:AAA family ATPase n=1 Tax=Nocardiopsis halophila TaxID=141692 RepID=UPI001267D7DE